MSKYTSSSPLEGFPHHWIALDTAILQSLRLRMLKSVSPFFFMSLLMVSMHLNVGLSLGLTPSTPMSSTVRVIWLSSLHLTCPYQRSRFCIRCVVIGWTVAAALITSFRIIVVSQANALYPPQHSYFSFIYQHLILLFHCPAFSPICHSMFYKSYWYYECAWRVLSCHIWLQLLLCICSRLVELCFFLQSAVDPHSVSNIDPICLKVVTFLISSPPSLTLLSWHGDSGIYPVLLLLTLTLVFSIAFLHNHCCSSVCSRMLDRYISRMVNDNHFVLVDILSGRSQLSTFSY